MVSRKRRPRVGDEASGQRLVAKIQTWCRDCKDWRVYSLWKVTRIGGVELTTAEQHHMLHCETCGLERRLERPGRVTEFVAPADSAARKVEA